MQRPLSRQPHDALPTPPPRQRPQTQTRPELAIIKVRRIAEAVAEEWTPDEPQGPSDVIQRIVQAGFRLPTFPRLSRYLNNTQREGEVPDAESIVLSLLPWAEHDRYRELLRWELPVPAPRP